MLNLIDIYLRTADGYFIPEKIDPRNREFYTNITRHPKAYLIRPTDGFTDVTAMYYHRVYKRYGQSKNGIPVYEEQLNGNW